MMNRLFGTAAPAAPKPTDALKQLRATSDTLGKRADHLEHRAKLETEGAKKKMAAKDRRGALLHMKRKKMFEAQIERVQKARSVLEEQMMALEAVNLNLEVVGAMKTGANAMKQIHATIDADSVDETMAEIGEQLQEANEIGNIISEPLSSSGVIDDSELGDELDALIDDDLAESLSRVEASTLAPKTAPTMPKVPVVDPVAADEDAELRELELAMAT